MFSYSHRRLLAVSAAVVGSAAVYVIASNQSLIRHPSIIRDQKYHVVPSRQELQARVLESNNPNKEFDLLVIGGGATGSGITLDATLRGLNVACIEQEDFSAGTSSRSTKLIHGGVRYLEKAFTQLDIGQLELVMDALHERKVFINTAPHLSHPLPIITPCFQWWEVPYYWAGLKVYDLFAFGRHLYASYYLSAKEAGRQFPMMRTEGLKGAVVYYDGQMNDSRMNVSLAVTAALHGAVTLNHTRVSNLLKDDSGKVIGAQIIDRFTNETRTIRAKCVVNACGPFVDHICELDDPKHTPMIIPAQGSHLILPDFYSPANMGLIIPKTKDGRVVFMLPWLGHTIAGTTDEKVDLTTRPFATEDEERFILEALSDFLRVPVRPQDVMATWAGIRPLSLDPTKKDTQSLSRDHVIVESPSGLITVTGGKWTTYRKMAQDTVDQAVSSAKFAHAKPCITENFAVIGGLGWDEAYFTTLTQNYYRTKQSYNSQTRAPMTSDIALHLSHAYGTQAFKIAELAQNGWGRRLAHGHPYLEAEVIYTIHHEFAQTAVDVLARRTRLAFIDSASANRAINRVVEIMGKELGWSRERRLEEVSEAQKFLDTMTVFGGTPNWQLSDPPSSHK